MKICCISDTHNRHRRVVIPECDVLIHAGDATIAGTEAEFIEFGSWMDGLSATHKIFVPGNHDWLFQIDEEAGCDILRSCDVLIDESIMIDGVKFWGAPWQPQFGGWAFNLPRGDPLMDVWSAIPMDTDVLITHGPPVNTLDECPDIDGRGMVNVGCDALSDRLSIVSPRLHVFGHIHEGYGRRDGHITSINASICDGHYHPVNRPQMFEFHHP